MRTSDKQQKRGSGTGTKNGENGKGGGEKEDTVGARGIINYKKKGKRERRRRERVKSHGRKKGGVSGGYSWGKAACIVMVSK